jgi:lysophospholipase L1-like esterase
VGVLLAAEIGLRVFLGFGNPPLFVADDVIEYMMVPGKYSRFGNSITINSAHMRATPEQFLKRSSPSEVRVLVMGDSVIQGGNQTDDADLAVSMMRTWTPPTATGGLSGSSGPLTTLNISCNSWGPGNVLEFLKRFGTFEADVAILVLNGWDYGDVRLWLPMSPETPTTKPWCALEEIRRNYGKRYAPLLFGKANWGDPGYDEANPPEKYGQQSLRELTELVALLRGRGIKVAAVYQPRRDEIEGTNTLVGASKIIGTLEQLDVPVTPNNVALTAELLRRGDSNYARFYRDQIHLSKLGHQVMLESLKEAFMAAK